MQGDLYVGREGQTFPQFTSYAAPGTHMITTAPALSGGYFQTGWTHHYSNGSDSTLQFYFDRYHREGILNENRNTFNIDFQHRLQWGSRQDVVWGAAYRSSTLDSIGNFSFSLVPPDLTTQLFSSFLQDEIALVPNHLSFTLGTKLEHNYYTGWGVLPSARLAWKVNDRSTAWAAVSRAIRTPASFDTAPLAHPAGYIGAAGIPVVVRLQGNPRAQNEDLLAYEVGYRTSVSERLSIDTAAYYNIYTHSTTIEPLSPFLEITPFPPHVVALITVANLMRGESHGFEGFATWRITDRWTLTPAYAFEVMHMHLAAGSLDTQSVLNKEGSTPQHWARIASQFRLPRGFSWSLSSTATDRLPARNVPGYVRVDSQLSWSAREDLSLAIVGQNLSRDKHMEFVDIWGATASSQLKRSVFARFTWTF
jgi:iron complex outermembrane receptor protein